MVASAGGKLLLLCCQLHPGSRPMCSCLHWVKGPSRGARATRASLATRTQWPATWGTRSSSAHGDLGCAHGHPSTPPSVGSTLPLGVSPLSLTCPHDSHALSRFKPSLPPCATSSGLPGSPLSCAYAFAHLLAPCSPCIAMLVLACQELIFAFALHPSPRPALCPPSLCPLLLDHVLLASLVLSFSLCTSILSF